MPTIIFLLIVLSSCEAVETAQTKDVEPIRFSGYVQRAFELTVNGVEFTDSEHFYTRFIPELILADDDYKDRFAASAIEVEGAYGVETFGADTAVIMAPSSGDGHVFQTRTNGRGQFKVEVPSAAKAEIFRAKIIIRIGLVIDETRYCYLLTGTRDDIEVTEDTKPIVFDDFKTQLNAYNCDKAKDELIEIPETAAPEPATWKVSFPYALDGAAVSRSMLYVKSGADVYRIDMTGGVPSAPALDTLANDLDFTEAYENAVEVGDYTLTKDGELLTIGVGQ